MPLTLSQPLKTVSSYCWSNSPKTESDCQITLGPRDNCPHQTTLRCQPNCFGIQSGVLLQSNWDRIICRKHGTFHEQMLSGGTLGVAGEFRSLGGTGFRIEANENFRRNPSGLCRGPRFPDPQSRWVCFSALLQGSPTPVSLPVQFPHLKKHGVKLFGLLDSFGFETLYIPPDSRTAHLLTSYPLDFPPLSEGPDHLFINSPGQAWIFDFKGPAHKPLSKASHKRKLNICSGLSRGGMLHIPPLKANCIKP